MIPAETPKDIKEKYDVLLTKFENISNDWKKYNDEIIPEEPKFAVEIIDFLILLIQYVIKNITRTDLQKWKEVFIEFSFAFQYGPEERNYLDFDEGSITHILWPSRDWDKPIKKSDILLMKKKLLTIKKKFE